MMQRGKNRRSPMLSTLNTESVQVYGRAGPPTSIKHSKCDSAEQYTAMLLTESRSTLEQTRFNRFRTKIGEVIWFDANNDIFPLGRCDHRFCDHTAAFHFFPPTNCVHTHLTGLPVKHWPMAGALRALSWIVTYPKMTSVLFFMRTCVPVVPNIG